MALTENERLTRSVNTLTDALEELTERNKRLESIVPDVETLLWFCDKHMENVRAIQDRATEKELTGLKAHTRLRVVFPKPKGEEQE